MKIKYLLIAFSFIPFYVPAQTLLFSESFETDGEGVRYTTNTFNLCSTPPMGNSDYFLRTNTNPVTLSGCTGAVFGSSLTNLQGSYFWASEDIRTSSPVPNSLPPGFITTQSINISGYNNLNVSLYIACSNNNNIRWEWSDSINIKASINGGPFILVGRFMGNAEFGGNLRQDSNLDGLITGADPVTNYDNTNFQQVSFNIPGTGPNLQIMLDFDQIGGSEELAIDLIEVRGFPFLPVELTRFTATSEPDGVLLNWNTASEKNNAGFLPERSLSGTEWEVIGFVEGQGTTASAHDYSFRDASPHTGTSYYRLRQLNTDGSETYSGIASVIYDGSGNNDHPILVTPNPATEDVVHLQIPAHWGDNNKVMLFHSGGQCVRQAVLPSGTQSFDITGLPDGLYSLRVWNNSTWVSNKLIIR